MKQKTLSNLILIAYALMMIVSLVSAVDLFKISHPNWGFGWIMSIAIEISIAALLMINRVAPEIKSALYVLGFITLFQICANTYSAYIHIDDITAFAQLFAIDDWEVIDQKRILAFSTGGILPAICLALIYIQNEARTYSEANITTKEIVDGDINNNDITDTEHTKTSDIINEPIHTEEVTTETPELDNNQKEELPNQYTEEISDTKKETSLKKNKSQKDKVIMNIDTVDDIEKNEQKERKGKMNRRVDETMSSVTSSESRSMF